MTIGERIREARTAKGLTQEQLAEQVHVTKQAVYKYETGIVFRWISWKALPPALAWCPATWPGGRAPLPGRNWTL